MYGALLGLMECNFTIPSPRLESCGHYGLFSTVKERVPIFQLLSFGGEILVSRRVYVTVVRIDRPRPYKTF